MRAARAGLAAALLSAAVGAQAPAVQLAAAQSEIGFTTRQMGVPVDGHFTRFTVQLALDPKHPEAGQVNLAIDTGSARFGAPETDAEVKKPVWLGTSAFPQAQFQSSRIRSMGSGRFEVTGTLTIKGLARELTVPVLLAPAGALSTASGTFTVKRLDFKVGEAEWSDTSLVADEVQVRFKLAMSGLPAP